MSSSKLEDAALSKSIDTVQEWPPIRVANQNGDADGTGVASSPSVKQNKMEGHEPSGKTKKKRKRRTLKDLVRVCEELGDRSDKSEIVARWKNYRKDPEWKDILDLRLRDIIHELVINLEKLSGDLQTQGGASGKVRDVVRERYWEASPLTSVENTLEEEIFVPKWTRLQVESWALYMESQIVFASLGIRISRRTRQFADLEGQKKAEMGSFVEAYSLSDADLFDNFDLTPNISDSDSAYSDYECYLNVVGYRLAADFTIPISRFTSRTRLELKRMSQVPCGKARALQLALMFRLDVLGFAKINTVWWREGVYATDTLLLILLSQEQEDRYPEHPLDCANAFLYLTSYIKLEGRGDRVLDQLESVLDEILPLVVRDLRREYRRNLMLAFDQRLPTDIYEVILDWVEVAHNIPKTVEEYVIGLRYPKEYA